jgi:Ca2+:H+ antiporter
LTEMIIALTALQSGQYVLVKASLAGAIVTNTLFMMGASFLLGGLKHHDQQFNPANARLQVGMLFLAAFALMVPSAVASANSQAVTQTLSLGISALLIITYGLSLFFTLGTHSKLFSSAAHAQDSEETWPVAVALATLAATTVMVALVSEVFIESVQGAASTLGLSSAFVGFIVVALVGGAAEMTSSFAAAIKNRMDMSMSIAFGSAIQIALFVAPVLVIISYFVGPTPMSLQFQSGALVMMFVATSTASLVTNTGQSTWFIGVLMLMVYLIFAMTLYILPGTA